MVYGISHTPLLDPSMGNYTLAYLQNSNIPINCSVYSLTNGTIKLLEHYSQTWNNDSSLHEILPAYYITNCSISKLIELVTQEKSNSSFEDLSDLNQSPYNQKDNGDTFVALLFALCGSCVSCWMLSLLLYLNPKHKRKPWLTQITTIFYAIVTSVLLNTLTKESEIQYHDGSLDIIKLHYKLYNTNVYRVLIILTQCLTMGSWFEIIQKLVRPRYKFISGFISFIFMGFYFSVFTYYQVIYNTSKYIHTQFESVSAHYTWSILRAVGRLIVVTWLGGILMYYTTMIKNPRKICYSKKLFPLALFVWFLFALDIVITILRITLFRYSWLVKTWLVLVPYLLEVILLTVIWEWVFNIWILEKRFELMNVLGRRISCEDVIDFRDEESGKRQTNNRFTGWIMNRAAQKKCEIEERSEESLKDFTSDEQTDDWESLSRVMEEREGQGFESENDTADDYESWIQEEDDEEDWRERGTRCSTESN